VIGGVTDLGPASAVVSSTLTIPWNVPLGTENVTGPRGASAQPSSTAGTPAVPAVAPPLPPVAPALPPVAPAPSPALPVPDAPPVLVAPLVAPLPPVGSEPPLAVVPPAAAEPEDPPLDGAFPAPPLPLLAPVPDGGDSLPEQANDSEESEQATSESVTSGRRIGDSVAHAHTRSASSNHDFLRELACAKGAL
jgi:hypothetical protein